MMKSERFGLVLSPAEKRALLRLADAERISAAAVVRRLIWDAAKHLEGGARSPGTQRRMASPSARRCDDDYTQG